METRFAGDGAHVRAARRSFAVMVAVLAVSLTGVQAGSAASVAPWIHVQNGGFANQAGQPVILRGVDQQGGTGTMSDQFAANLGSSPAPLRRLRPSRPQSRSAFRSTRRARSRS